MAQSVDLVPAHFSTFVTYSLSTCPGSCTQQGTHGAVQPSSSTSGNSYDPLLPPNANVAAAVPDPSAVVPASLRMASAGQPYTPKEQACPTDRTKKHPRLRLHKCSQTIKGFRPMQEHMRSDSPCCALLPPPPHGAWVKGQVLGDFSMDGRRNFPFVLSSTKGPMIYCMAGWYRRDSRCVNF